MVDDRETLKAGVVMFVTVSGTIFYQGIIFIQPIFVLKYKAWGINN